MEISSQRPEQTPARECSCASGIGTASSLLCYSWKLPAFSVNTYTEVRAFNGVQCGNKNEQTKALHNHMDKSHKCQVE